MTRAAAFATDATAAAAANAMLPRGNAVDAVCAGVLAASAVLPGVLFGPVQLLITGPGLGMRAVDGRLRQPGLGAARPRGFLDAKSVTAAARLAVPSLPGTIAMALTMFGTVTLRKAMGPALDLHVSKRRRALLAALGREGVGALARSPWVDGLLEVAGPLAGGIFTAEDLGALRPGVSPCTLHHNGEVEWATLPFFDAAARGGQRTRIVCAADGRGVVAALGYEVEEDGIAIEALDLVAPPRAIPVMRGERRTSPNTPLECVSSIALIGKESAVGVAGQAHAASRLAKAIAEHAKGTPLETALQTRAPSAAAIRGERGVRGYSFTP